MRWVLVRFFTNTTGQQNSAIGDATLFSNTTGSFNTADGIASLQVNTTGNGNIALGYGAGNNLDTGNNNIDIGNLGVAGESNTIRIGGDVGIGYGSQTATFVAAISGTAVVGDAVVVDANGQLGTVASARVSRRRSGLWTKRAKRSWLSSQCASSTRATAKGHRNLD